MFSAHVWIAIMLARKMEGDLSRPMDSSAGSPFFEIPMPVPLYDIIVCRYSITIYSERVKT